MLAATAAHADDRHGPSAPGDRFPSHELRLRAHTPRTQLGFHYGLLQPILLKGFNAAVDLRMGRLVLSYSHGASLDLTRTSRTATEKAAGLGIRAPYSTGFGVGVVLIDELYVMADFKLHHFELDIGADRASYSTITVGAELGWRFFVWRGLYVSPVVRYWPNVWTSAPDGGVVLDPGDGAPLVHHPVKQGASGLFANLLIGWAFDL